jgi:arylsulfatase A-like enzyme
MYSQRAVAAIHSHAAAQAGGGSSAAAAPLFLYLSLQNIHGPLQAEEKYLAQYNSSIFANRRTLDAMVTTVDDTVANVTAALVGAGMYNDTLMIIASDNGGPIQEPSGGWSAGNNWPLRGGKYSFFEGGIRVVGMVRHPVLLQAVAGTAWDGLMHACDWYATLCGLAGANPSDEAPGRVPTDSVDVWPALSGAGGVSRDSPRTELLLGLGLHAPPPVPPHGSGGYNGVLRRADGMKLVVGKQFPSAWVGPRYPNATTPTAVFPPPLSCAAPGCLFNLSSDPGERMDLAAEMPELAAAIRARYEVLAQRLYAPNNDGPRVPAHVPSAAACERMEKAGGWWGPWVP